VDPRPRSAGAGTERPWLLNLKAPPREENAQPAPGGPNDRSPSLPSDALGVALSGGGIRSAAFCLGVLQGMARTGWLRRVDFLSTVSGGGFIGAFLGRSFDALRDPRTLLGETRGAVPERVERELTDPNAPSVGWLRTNANYLAPGGLADLAVNLAGFLRGLLAVYLVLGVFLLGLFGALNALAYGDWSGTWIGFAVELSAGLTPLVGLLPEAWGGPWLALAEIALWLAVVPLMVGYWLIARDLPEAFLAAALVAAAVLGATLTLLAGSPLPLAILAAAVLWVWGAWATVRRAEGPPDPFHPHRLMLAGDHLTRRLALWLVVALGFAAFGAVDGFGRWLAGWMLEGGLTVPNIAGWLTSIGSVVLVSASVLRMVARVVGARMERKETLLRTGGRLAWVAGTLVLGALPPLAAFSFLSHSLYENGDAYTQGVALTGVAVAVSLLFGTRACVPFVTRSGPLGTYAGRLARTFLGSVNPARQRFAEGRDVSRPVAGDDVPFSQYRPDLAGGPLHLITCALNETVELTSERAVRDRQAANLALGPAGMSVDRNGHALWTGHGSWTSALETLSAERPDPFGSRRRGPIQIEALGLREWMAISGAAISPGMGRRTALNRALLATLANARLGYWWDSGLSARERLGAPRGRGPFRALAAWLARRFETQMLLVSELTGRFGGPWPRYWYLSDGGDFEATGAFELLRRRLPYVVLCDANEDPRHLGTELARLMRLVRIELGAEMTAVSETPAALQELGVPPDVAERLGSLNDLLPGPGERPRRHAALFRVRYPEPPRADADDPWLARQETWLLYIKATVTGDEPADVRGYAAAHPDFPHETTLDQQFDEPQWESYRRLGEHIAERLFHRSTSAPS